MNNREKLIDVMGFYLVNASSFKKELNYLMEVDHEEPYDLADALNDLFDMAEINNDYHFVSKCRDILITVGAFVEAPIKTCVGRDVRFKRNGVMYDWPHAGGWEEWLERECNNV